MLRIISISVLILFSVATGFPRGNAFEATHLFSPPLFFFNSDRFDLNGDVSHVGSSEDDDHQKILKIFVSPDDSSIRFKKDTIYNVTYHLEWNNNAIPEDCSKLRISFGMMDKETDDGYDWDQSACITIPELDNNTFSYTIGCDVNSFSLNYHGRDNGNTEIVISKVEKYIKTSTTTSATSTSATSDATKSTASSSSISTSTSQTMVEKLSTFDDRENITENVERAKANVKAAVFLSDGINTFNDIIGWIYFVAWSVSFYPQVWINFKRKSVEGLNFDFLSLNVVGFTLYSCYNCGIYFNEAIQEMYFEEHDTQNVPVKVNDVVFGLHAVFACIVTIVQCFIYERGGQTVSKPCIGALIGIALFIISTSISAGCDAIDWLEFLTWASYVKLGITIVKYMPQAWMNFRRKSTVGWSIGNVLLDFTGGSLSMLQMIMDSYNLDDWSSFFGDFTKFGLGMFSVLFDILFIMQHYVCYRNAEPRDSTTSTRVPTDEERAHGHENMAYVAEEVASVASNSLDDKKD